MYKNKRIGAIISVRLDSNRLPNKALIDLSGKTLLERVIDNISHSRLLDNIVVATTTNSSDDKVIELCSSINTNFYRGDEINLVKRYKDTAEYYKYDIIVRVTGDNPLTSFEVIDLLIKSHFENDADYSKPEDNFLPIGVGSEIINFNSLIKLIQSGVDLSFSEYMSYYFLDNSDHFKLNNVKFPREFYGPSFRLTVDYLADVQLIRKIFEEQSIDKNVVSLTDTIKYLCSHPELAKTNNKYIPKYISDVELMKKIHLATKIN